MDHRILFNAAADTFFPGEKIIEIWVYNTQKIVFILFFYNDIIEYDVFKHRKLQNMK